MEKCLSELTKVLIEVVRINIQLNFEITDLKKQLNNASRKKKPIQRNIPG